MCSKPVYGELLAWRETDEPHEPPASGMGDAIRYPTNHQVALRRFLGGGVIPIDNGIVEGLHVRTAITRKNYLFATSDAGGEPAAILSTILGCCCQLCGVNPVEYLADELARSGRLRDVRGMLPLPRIAEQPSLPRQPLRRAASAAGQRCARRGGRTRPQGKIC